MLTIPLRTVPSQITRIVLGGQNCQINVYQKYQGVFVDISVDDVDIVSGAIGRDMTPIVSREYTGFLGNLLFIDTKGNDNPNYEEFNTRFFLVYLTAEEYALLRQ